MGNLGLWQVAGGWRLEVSASKDSHDGLYRAWIVGPNGRAGLGMGPTQEHAIDAAFESAHDYVPATVLMDLAVACES